MFLSDRDLDWAIEQGRLIVEPRPTRIDPTSIDLRLDSIAEAKVWDVNGFQKALAVSGVKAPELHLGSFKYGEFAERYLIPPPPEESADPDIRVVLRGKQVIVRPLGFLLWQTKERVGTPEEGADLICFVDGKSTRARTGIVIHLTAPTIHGGWNGKITLEIVNHGPFHFVLQEDDVIAQLTVAKLTSIPNRTMQVAGSATLGQMAVTGQSVKN